MCDPPPSFLLLPSSFLPRYDRYGLAGVDGSGGSGGGGDGGGGGYEDGESPFDLFRNLFGGRRRSAEGSAYDTSSSSSYTSSSYTSSSGAPREPPRERLHRHTCPVTLEEIYTKRIKHLRLTKQVIVDSKGERAREAGGRTCAGCNGQGRKVVTQRSNYVLRQFESECDACNGVGRVLNYGYSTRPEKVTLSVDLQEWAKRGGRYHFPDTGNDLSAARWDTRVTIKIARHATFVREGRNLATTVTLDWYVCFK
jgi:DnaJ-class molecular chaperone